MIWRKIPGWSGYLIDSRGRVRTDRGYSVPVYGQFYYLQRKGRRKRISRADLLQLTRSMSSSASKATQDRDFELSPHGREVSGFVPIPGCPGYTINQDGVVRDSAGEMKERDQAKSNYPNIFINGRHRRLDILLCLTFGPGAATAAGLPEPGAKRLARRINAQGVREAPVPRVLKTQGRFCHDCGRPTHDCRCPECWRKLRGFSAEEAAAYETPFAL